MRASSAFVRKIAHHLAPEMRRPGFLKEIIMYVLVSIYTASVMLLLPTLFLMIRRGGNEGKIFLHSRRQIILLIAVVWAA